MLPEHLKLHGGQVGHQGQQVGIHALLMRGLGALLLLMLLLLGGPRPRFSAGCTLSWITDAAVMQPGLLWLVICMP